jgi:hypothetical protein
MKHGQWVIYKGQAAIVAEPPSEGELVLHVVDAKGETLMEFNEGRQRFMTKSFTVPEGEVRAAKPEEIPQARRPKESKTP